MEQNIIAFPEGVGNIRDFLHSQFRDGVPFVMRGKRYLCKGWRGNTVVAVTCGDGKGLQEEHLTITTLLQEPITLLSPGF